MPEYKLTASLEDYLEAFYEISNEKHGVRAVDIANRLNVKRSSVSDAIKSLSTKKLVNYSKYDEISLTEEGQKRAQEVARKHKILYEFLTKVLGISSVEASENACRMEHVISDNVLTKLIEYIEK